MPCLRPLTGWRSNERNEKTGKRPIVFKRTDGIEHTMLQIPCGQCQGCRLDKSLDWAIRCVHEKKLHENNCFITLTYDDECLPKIPSGLPTLVKDHWIKFMKRLRKKYGEGIRFFHCGEYGDLFDRPHYHAIIFGHDFEDKRLHSIRDGIRLCESEELNKLWEYQGFCTVGEVTFESAAYVARYIMKKVTGKGADDHYKGRQPDYILMSRRPGIGRPWLDKYMSDVYPHDFIIHSLGKKARPSRYYDSIYDKINSQDMEKIKKLRLEKIKKYKYNNTPCRLIVREIVLEEKIKKLKRNL